MKRGQRHTQESIEKIRAGKQNRGQTEETRKKISESKKGKSAHSAESRERMRAAALKRAPHSEETRKKIGLATKSRSARKQTDSTKENPNA